MIKIVHAYPDLLNLYGDYANVKLLEKRLEGCGEQIQVRSFSLGNYIDISDADLLYFGAGTEGGMLHALEDFRRYRGELERMLASGGRILATGSAMALLCRSVTDTRDGRTYEGLGLVDGTARIVKGRRYGEVVCSGKLCGEKIFGAVNSSIDFDRDADAEPFCTVEKDFSGRLSGGEGFAKGGVFATELTGPLLFRNPALLDAFAGMLCQEPAPCGGTWYGEMKEAYLHVETVLTGEAKK